MTRKTRTIDVISWVDEELPGETFYHTGAAIKSAISSTVNEYLSSARKEKDDLEQALLKVMSSNDGFSDSDEITIDEVAGVLVAMVGKERTVDLDIAACKARAINDKLEKVKRLKRVQRNLIDEAQYELDSYHLEDFGL